MHSITYQKAQIHNFKNKYYNLDVCNVKITLGQWHEKILCTILEYRNKQQ